MRVIAPVLVIVGLFMAIDRGFGLLADHNTAKRAEMLAGGREMYGIADDMLSNKPINGQAKTRMGAILQKMATKVQKIELDFETKYGPLYDLMNDPAWLTSKEQMQVSLPLTRTWAKDAMVVWQKEKDLQGEYMAEMADELKVSKKAAMARPNVRRSIKSFDMYKDMIDNGRAYFQTVEKYLAFTIKNHKQLKTEAGAYYFEDAAIDRQAAALEAKMQAAAEIFAESGKAFEMERAEIRADAMRAAKIALSQ